MATYDNNLRIKEIATGAEAGTWGASTNTNLELIGQALGYSTQNCFSSDADATTTIADGSTDPARAMYFKVTSSATLTATRVLNFAPATVSRVMFIENATTGGQSISISQGSGTNVGIGNGKVKALYLDGGGASANVEEVLDNVALTNLTLDLGTTVSAILDEDDMSSDSDTALATQQSIKAYVDSVIGSPTTDLVPDVDDSLDLGSASKRWQDLYLSGGVYIGGTSSANFIDDYEEGTFTISSVLGPFSGSGGGLSSSVGTYVQTGNMVMGSLLVTYASSVTFANVDDAVLLNKIPFWPTTQQVIAMANHSSSTFGGLVGLSGLDIGPSNNLPGYATVYGPFEYGFTGLGPYNGVQFNFYFYINQ